MRRFVRTETFKRTLVGAVAVLAASVVRCRLGSVRTTRSTRPTTSRCRARRLARRGSCRASAKNIAHVANVCGFVGTDIEFQSRTAADGTVHDYAFVGTMGARHAHLRRHRPGAPVRGRRVHRSRLAERRPGARRHCSCSASTRSASSGATSACLHEGQRTAADRPASTSSGWSTTARRRRSRPSSSTATCRALASAGAHTTTIHPSGDWISP